ncbi:ribosome maturation factor RimP [Paenibacillus thermotolerans]|uniref:ribosome maturation factor RimP n=1 Tax=Paenibacillus thermotolerans TaxID=3027807 RepID=UPI0023683292|nr:MULTISPECIES: ribosome maturation factor RimP [unclassified Paenibacillus]
MSATGVTKTVAEMVQPFLDREGFELVDVEYVKEGGNYFLRVYVDKEGGIDIDECGRISEYLSDRLDAEDPIPDAYILEVSSPGAERPLKKPEDFKRAVGKDVYITTYEPIGGKKEFEGRLLSYDEQQLTVQDGKKTVELPVNKIAGARLTIIF